MQGSKLKRQDNRTKKILRNDCPHSEFLPDGLQFLSSLRQIGVGLRQTHPLDLYLAEDLSIKHVHISTKHLNTKTAFLAIDKHSKIPISMTVNLYWAWKKKLGLDSHV